MSERALDREPETVAADVAAPPDNLNVAPFQLDRFHTEAAVAVDSTSSGCSKVRIELGRTTLSRREIDSLTLGTVVRLQELDRDPLNVFANERLVARGELRVRNGRFCLQVTEII